MATALSEVNGEVEVCELFFSKFGTVLALIKPSFHVKLLRSMCYVISAYGNLTDFLLTEDWIPKTVFSGLQCKYLAETLSENVVVGIKEKQQNVSAENIVFKICTILINIFHVKT